MKLDFLMLLLAPIVLILVVGAISGIGRLISNRWGIAAAQNVGVAMLLIWLASGIIVGMSQCSVKHTDWSDDDMEYACPGPPRAAC